MNVTLCDMDDCDEVATVHIIVLDNENDWHGMEADLCGRHDNLGPLYTQWEQHVAEIEAAESEAANA